MKFTKELLRQIENGERTIVSDQGVAKVAITEKGMKVECAKANAYLDKLKSRRAWQDFWDSLSG